MSDLLPAAYGIAGFQSVVRNVPLHSALEEHLAAEGFNRLSASAKRGAMTRRSTAGDDSKQAQKRVKYLEERLKEEMLLRRHSDEAARTARLVAINDTIWRLSEGLFGGKAFGDHGQPWPYCAVSCGDGEYRMHSPEEMRAWLREALSRSRIRKESK
jgi:hypothetical protein